jgi:hypothetical protein
MRMTEDQLGAELRALREIPNQQFAAELDAWAAEGFPSAKQLEESTGPSSKRSFIGRRPMLAALSAAAVIVMVVGVSVVAYLHQRDTGGMDSSGSGSGEILSGKIQKNSLHESAPSAATGSSQQTTAVPLGQRPRNSRSQIQQLSASLGLSTGTDEIQSAADGVVDVTNRYDGFVDSSDVHVGGPRSHASFSLRIPAAHLREALDDISGLGRVTVRDEGSSNVTGAYVDTGKAFRDARTRVDSLVTQLNAASTAADEAAIRAELVTARQELAAARSALRGIKQQVTYAPLTVQIRSDGAGGSWSIGDAADDAIDVLKAIAGGTLVTLAVLLPLSALFLLGWLGVRELSRRRRDAYLDR